MMRLILSPDMFLPFDNCGAWKQLRSELSAFFTVFVSGCDEEQQDSCSLTSREKVVNGSVTTKERRRATPEGPLCTSI